MMTRKGGPKKSVKTRGPKKPVQLKTKQVSIQWTGTEATTVSLTGDFNNWDPQRHPLKKVKDGVWKVNLRLKPGRYEYMFIVDGEWREDPLNPNRVPNPHGGFNSICAVV